MAKSRMKTLKKARKYGAEFNRCIGDNMRCVKRFMIDRGIRVKVDPDHPTLAVLYRPPQMSWQEFCRIIRAALQPVIGSALLFSPRSRRSWVVSQRGMRPFIES
jgi:hypothetical protein